MYQLKLTLPGLPKTYNALRLARWQYSAEKRKWKTLIQLIMLQENLKKPKQPLTKCEVEYVLYSSRERDSDNLHSSFKLIQDLLVEVGIFVDDNPDVIGHPKVSQGFASRGEGYCEITIKEIGP